MIISLRGQCFIIPQKKTLDKIKKDIHLILPCFGCVVMPICDEPCKKLYKFFEKNFDLLYDYADKNTKNLKNNKRRKHE